MRLYTVWYFYRRIHLFTFDCLGTRPDRTWGPPSLLHNGYRVFPGGKAAGSLALTTHPHLGPRLKEE